MDLMILAAFVSFFALLVGCLIAPTESAAPASSGIQSSASMAD